MIDLLNLLYSKKIDVDEAIDIVLAANDAYHNNENSLPYNEELMLDKYEWTAQGQGAQLNVIAKWRYEGWPRICAGCGCSIDYTKFGWFVKNNMLYHIHCLDRNK